MSNPKWTAWDRCVWQTIDAACWPRNTDGLLLIRQTGFLFKSATAWHRAKNAHVVDDYRRGDDDGWSSGALSRSCRVRLSSSMESLSLVGEERRSTALLHADTNFSVCCSSSMSSTWYGAASALLPSPELVTEPPDVVSFQHRHASVIVKTRLYGAFETGSPTAETVLRLQCAHNSKWQ